MSRPRNIFPVGGGVALLATLGFLCGCASPETAATVRQAEAVVAEHQAPDQPPAEGPPGAFQWRILNRDVDTSRQHLQEIYVQQQEIILELRGKPDVPSAGPQEEQANDLDPNISNADLCNILEQQTKLIKALAAKKSRRGNAQR